jgi:flagellar hook-associated protein 1
MMSYRHAYSAASRLVTAVDEMLDQLINRTGVVGR